MTSRAREFVCIALLVAGCAGKQLEKSSAQPTADRCVALAPSDVEAISHRFLLIGDAGATKPREPVLERLKERADELPEHTTIVFLGDNVYPKGIPRGRDPEAERRMEAQLQVLRDSDVEGFFLPGNHDWAKGTHEGLAAIGRQEKYILGAGVGEFLPKGGCPGPVHKDRDGARLIVIDTQWLIHKNEKSYRDCFPGKTVGSEVEARKELFDQLTKMVEDANDRTVIVAAHHPLDTHGPHGGYFNWQDHLFPLTRLQKALWVPLPGVGSLYPLLRWHIVKDDQDLAGSGNKKMVHAIQEALAKAGKPVIFAAGHEHSLQVLRNVPGTSRVLVSGLGSSEKATPVREGDNTDFEHGDPGFMELDVLKAGGAYLRVYDGPSCKVQYETPLN